MTPGEQGGEGPILTKRIWKRSLEEVALDRENNTFHCFCC